MEYWKGGMMGELVLSKVKERIKKIYFFSFWYPLFQQSNIPSGFVLRTSFPRFSEISFSFAFWLWLNSKGAFFGWQNSCFFSMIRENSAGVVKLVDARDSKSRGVWLRVGSNPTSGTNDFNKLYYSSPIWKDRLFSWFDQFLTWKLLPRCHIDK